MKKLILFLMCVLFSVPAFANSKEKINASSWVKTGDYVCVCGWEDTQVEYIGQGKVTQDGNKFTIKNVFGEEVTGTFVNDRFIYVGKYVTVVAHKEADDKINYTMVYHKLISGKKIKMYCQMQAVPNE
jgi:hypothetical protein